MELRLGEKVTPTPLAVPENQSKRPQPRRTSHIPSKTKTTKKTPAASNTRRRTRAHNHTQAGMTIKSVREVNAKHLQTSHNTSAAEIKDICGLFWLTTPVRSSKRTAPKLHQSHDSVSSLMPPTSRKTGTRRSAPTNHYKNHIIPGRTFQIS